MPEKIAFNEPVLPTDTDKAAAEAGSRFLAHTLHAREMVRLGAGSGATGTSGDLFLSERLALLVQKVLHAVSEDQTVTVLPRQAEMTTNQAADFLGVSRPHLIKLLETGQIAFRRVGTKRRIPASDLARYRDENKAKRLQTLQALQDEAQALNMGY